MPFGKSLKYLQDHLLKEKLEVLKVLQDSLGLHLGTSVSQRLFYVPYHD